MALQEDIIKLTLAVYQVTGKFPENEPLRSQIRQKANTFLADFICLNPQKKEKLRINRQIETLLAYFSVAEGQNWLNNKNFKVLAKEYERVRQGIKEFTNNSLKNEEFFPETIQEEAAKRKSEAITQSAGIVQKSARESLSPSVRQKKIIEIAKNKGEVLLSELRALFSEITPRTLRRDLKVLVEEGSIERIRTGKEDVLFVLPQEIDKEQMVDRSF